MQFPGLTLTNLGANLLAKAQAGTQLVYTRVGLGSGKIPIDRGAWVGGRTYVIDDVVTITGGTRLVCITQHTSVLPEPTGANTNWAVFTGTTDARELTDLFHQEQSVLIASLATPGDGTCRIRFRLANKTLTTGFRLWEIGIFAQDPDEGEVLYGVTFASEADFIPPGGGITTMEKWVDIITMVDMAQDITANISELLVTATKNDIMSVLRRSYFNINTIGV